MADYFHFGLWKTETRNAKDAQENLAALMKSLIPQGVGIILDAGCGLGRTTHKKGNVSEEVDFEIESWKGCNRMFKKKRFSVMKYFSLRTKYRFF